MKEGFMWISSWKGLDQLTNFEEVAILQKRFYLLAIEMGGILTMFSYFVPFFGSPFLSGNWSVQCQYIYHIFKPQRWFGERIRMRCQLSSLALNSCLQPRHQESKISLHDLLSALCFFKEMKRKCQRKKRNEAKVIPPLCFFFTSCF